MIGRKDCKQIKAMLVCNAYMSKIANGYRVTIMIDNKLCSFMLRSINKPSLLISNYKGFRFSKTNRPLLTLSHKIPSVHFTFLALSLTCLISRQQDTNKLFLLLSL